MFYTGPNFSIDIAYCLWHPGKRPNAAKRIIAQAAQNNFDINYLIFCQVGIDYLDQPHLMASHNCANTHRYMIQNCIDKQYHNVLFLEDDAVFTNDAKMIMDKIHNVPSEYHQLTLGGYCVDPVYESRQEVPYDTNAYSNPSFIKVGFTWGLFGSVINHKCFHLMLNAEQGSLMDVAIRDRVPNANVYILNYPVIIERDEVAAVSGQYHPRNLYHQAVKEGRIDE